MTGLIVLLLAINLGVAARIYSAASPAAEKDDPYEHFKIIAEVMEMIRANYVDGDKVSYQDLTYDALKGMVDSLDPHSQFMNPKAFEDMQEDTEGKFGGLGIVISMSKDGFLTVVAPMEGTPGARAGLLPGDRIVRIEGKVTEKMSLQDAVRQLRGEPGTKITIGVFRPKTNMLKDYTIERAEIPVDSVKDVHGHAIKWEGSFPLIADKIGYIRITQFNSPTSDEVEAALEKLKKEGMTSLIIDLRNNPGGLLDSAIKIVSKFVSRGELVVSTEGRDLKQINRYQAIGGHKHLNLPIAILVNNGSASASEIVSGAMQDLKRAVIIGETTFGKGSVQSILKLPDGSALRLTTAKYYTPSHKVINEHGVQPDIIVPVSDEDEIKLAEQRARESLPPVAGAEKVELIKDVQLERAIDVLKGVNLFARQARIGNWSAKSVATP